jgi:hypothetical protein
MPGTKSFLQLRLEEKLCIFKIFDIKYLLGISDCKDFFRVKYNKLYEEVRE